MVPRLMVADKLLSHGAVRLATVLGTFDMSKKHISSKERTGRDRRSNRYATEGIVYPGNQTLAHAMGISEGMVIKYKRQLIEAGYLQERRRFSRTSLHVMKLPKVLSVRDLVKRFKVFSIPLQADDFVAGMGADDGALMSEIRRFLRW